MQSHEHEMGRDQLADELRAWNAASEALESECRHCGQPITYEDDEWSHSETYYSECEPNDEDTKSAEPSEDFEMPRTIEDLQSDVLEVSYRRSVRVLFTCGGPTVFATLEIDDDGEALRGTFYDSWAVPNERELYSDEVSALEAVYGPFEAVADRSIYR